MISIPVVLFDMTVNCLENTDPTKNDMSCQLKSQFFRQKLITSLF